MKVKNLSIYRHEIVQVSQAEERLKIAKDNLDTLSEENEQLKQRCEVLATELGTLLDNERETEQQFVYKLNNSLL